MEPEPQLGVDAIGRVQSLFETDSLPTKPYIMLIHHLSPHEPYIFREDCSVRKKYKFDMKSWGEKAIALYIDNLKCTNKKILKFIEMLDSKDPDSIVIIVGDHGSAFYVDWEIPAKKWSRKMIRERSSVISFQRFPEKCKEWLSDNINSVNLARLAFSCVSGSKPKLLPNKSYIYTLSSSGVHLVSESE